MGEMRVKRETERKEIRLWSNSDGFNNSELQFCRAENDKKLPSRDPLEYKSIVSQKRCCNNICQVAVLEELA